MLARAFSVIVKASPINRLQHSRLGAFTWVQFIGRYEAGRPSGPCWVRVKGGAFLHGEVDPDWRLTSENGTYLYPDLETAYNGVFRGGVMVCGRAALVQAAALVDNVLRIKVTQC